MPKALVTGSDGVGRVAKISQLRPNSLLLLTPTPPSFREKVSIVIAEHTLQGEVVFVSGTEVAIVFKTTPEIFELIELVEIELASQDIDRPSSLPKMTPSPSEDIISDLAAPAAPSGPPSVAPPLRNGNVRLNAQGYVQTQNALDTFGLALLLYSGRPLFVEPEGATPPPSAVLDNLSLTVEALPSGQWKLHAQDPKAVLAWLHRHRSALNLPTIEPSAQVPSTDVPSMIKDPVELTPPPLPEDALEIISEAPPAEPAPSTEELLPRMKSDGKTIVFESIAHYRREHSHNLQNGALSVLAPPLPLNSSHELHLEIPGRPILSLRATVTFLGEGTVGFRIEGFDVLKADLAAFIEDSTRPMRRRNSSVGRGHLSGIFHQGSFQTKFTVKELLGFHRRPARSAPECQGAYLRLLEYLFRQKGRYTIEFLQGDSQIRLWVLKGRLVFCTRTPSSESDKLGQRLVNKKVINKVALSTALRVAKEKEAPLGEVLLERGVLTQSNLSLYLKAQMLDRALQIRKLGEGSVKIGPWEEPPVSGKLAAYNGGSIMSALLREHVKELPVSELQAELDASPERLIMVSQELDKTALTTKEQQLLEQAEARPTTVGERSTLSAVPAQEVCRILALGRALGAVELLEPTSPESARSQTRDLLEQRLMEAESLPPFEALNLPWTATEHEIQIAYQAERELLMQKRKGPQDPLSPLIGSLLTALENAYTALQNQAERTRLRRSKGDGPARTQATEQLLHKAETALKREDFASAHALAQTAQEIHPSAESQALLNRLRAQAP